MKYDKKTVDEAYEKGQPLISDAEYDNLYGRNASAYVLPDKTPWEKVKLPYPMYSLDKVEVINSDNEVFWDNLKKWFKEPIVATPKYDGLSVYLEYKEGILVGAYTRGDGTTGENILRNILKADNVLLKLKNKNVKGLIGEIVFTDSVFEKHLKDEYSNSRNGAVGAVKDFSGRNAHFLSIRYHGMDIEDPAIKTEEDKYELMEKLGIKYIEYSLCSSLDQIKSCYNHLIVTQNDREVSLDGLVLKINSLKRQKELGQGANKNPAYGCAIKFPHPQKNTILKDIEWSFGNSGTLTPVAIVEEVDLGARVTRLSLANMDEIKRLWGDQNPSRGDILRVSRRGAVIPHVEEVIKRKTPSSPLYAPSKCPTCSAPTIVDGPFLECSNLDCDSRKLGDLYKWSNKIKEHFNCKGLGGERIEQMFYVKLIKTPDDLYKLKAKDLIGNLDGVKEAAAKNILSFQEHKVLPLDLFLGALNIPSIGQSIFKFIIDAGYDSLDKIQNIKVGELIVIPNLSEIRAKLIIDGLKKKKTLINNLLKYVQIEEIKVKSSGGSLSGKSFCFTGASSVSRPILEEMVIDNGGEVKSGVSSKLDFLVAGDNAGSKLDKANKLGIKVISEEQFRKML